MKKRKAMDIFQTAIQVNVGIISCINMTRRLDIYNLLLF